MTSSPLSEIVDVLTTSIPVSYVSIISVGSSVVFPSVSSPSSLTSLILLVPSWELAVASTLFLTNPESTSDWVMI